jgi:hypothetical protein
MLMEIFRRTVAVSLLLFWLASQSTGRAEAPDSCSLTFEGRARRAVKLRTPQAGVHYKKINGGSPITTDQWFETMCGFDSELPDQIPTIVPMQGLENKEVTLRGFLMGAKFEKDGDQDVHAEIAGSEDWEDKHVVVEVPPGKAFCDPRTALWSLIRTDFKSAGKPEQDHWIMDQPVEVRITGFVFLDSSHGTVDTCTKNGGRGLRKKGGVSKVEGLWEIHPVIKVEKVTK